LNYGISELPNYGLPHYWYGREGIDLTEKSGMQETRLDASKLEFVDAYLQA